MLSLGLSRSRYAEYRATLASSHEVKVTCIVMTPEHQVVRHIFQTLVAGQVDVTTPVRDGDSVEISRTATLRFLDPNNRIGLDDTSPDDNSFYLNRMIRVVYSVRCSFGWVDVPVFTGPIVSVDRDGEEVEVECQGKEIWALGSAIRTGVLKGTRDEVTKNLLGRAGEARRYMQIPAGGKTSATIGRETQLWLKAWKLQSAAGRVLFYDGRGVVKAIKKPTRTALRLRGGDGGYLTAPPQVSYSVSDNLINYARVTGRKPSKGKKTRPVGVMVAPSSHPLSPARLGRNGQPLYLTDNGRSIVNNDDIKTNAGCRQVARRMIEDSLAQHVEATIETFPIPDLEPWDIVHVVSDVVSVRIRVNAFTIPLVQTGDGESMSIGALKNTKQFRYAKRRAKPRRR